MRFWETLTTVHFLFIIFVNITLLTIITITIIHSTTIKDPFPSIIHKSSSADENAAKITKIEDHKKDNKKIKPKS